jgi:hypothetical protein
MAISKEIEDRSEHLAALTLTVKSKILDGIAKLISEPDGGTPMATMYTMSSSTKYGMYQMKDKLMGYEEIWQTISGMKPAASVPSAPARTSASDE